MHPDRLDQWTGDHQNGYLDGLNVQGQAIDGLKYKPSAPEIGHARSGRSGLVPMRHVIAVEIRSAGHEVSIPKCTP